MDGHRQVTPPHSSGSEDSDSSDYPRPQYYIVRGDKTCVPLIAVDEISPAIRLRGIPLSLSGDDIEEWNMARVGDQVNRPKKYYSVQLNSHEHDATVPANNNFKNKGRNEARALEHDVGAHVSPNHLYQQEDVH